MADDWGTPKIVNEGDPWGDPKIVRTKGAGGVRLPVTPEVAANILQSQADEAIAAGGDPVSIRNTLAKALGGYGYSFSEDQPLNTPVTAPTDALAPAPTNPFPMPAQTLLTALNPAQRNIPAIPLRQPITVGNPQPYAPGIIPTDVGGPLPYSEATMEALKSGVTAPAGGALQAMGELPLEWFGGLKQLADQGSPAAQALLGPLQSVLDPISAAGVEATDLAADQAAKANTGVNRPESIMDAVTNPGNAGRYYSNIGAQSAPAIGLAMLSRNPTIASGVVGGTTAGQQYGARRAAGDTPNEAAMQAGVAGAIETGLAKLPFEVALSGMPALKRIPTAMGAEALTEGMTGAGQSAAEDLLAGVPVDEQKLVQNVIDSAIVGAGLGAGEAVVGQGKKAAPVADAETLRQRERQALQDAIAVAQPAMDAQNLAINGPDPRAWDSGPAVPPAKPRLRPTEEGGWAEAKVIPDPDPQNVAPPVAPDAAPVSLAEAVQPQPEQAATPAAPQPKPAPAPAQTLDEAVDPLAPRMPAPVQLEPGVTREQLQTEFDSAQTDDTRATAAARIAAFTAQQEAPRGQTEDQARTRPQTLQEGQGAPAPRPAPAPQGKAAPLTRTNRIVSAQREADIPADVAARNDLANTGKGAEGFYDQETGDVYVITENLDVDERRGWTIPARKLWVAGHEGGHAGLRQMAAQLATENVPQAKQLSVILNRAGQNPTVAAVARRMAGSSERATENLSSERSVDEAMAELYSAVETGNYDEIEMRYGIKVPQAQRKTLAGYVARVVEKVRNLFRAEGKQLTDGEIYETLKGARKARKESMPVETTAEGGVVASKRSSRSWAANPDKARKSLGLQGKPTVRAIGEAFNRHITSAFGPIPTKSPTQEHLKEIAKAMADEVRFQLDSESDTGTGVGWYSENYPAAVKELAKVYPELADNETARGMFTALLAVTSNGEKVQRNIAMALDMYDQWRQGSPVSSVIPGGKRADALANNAAVIDSLIDRIGAKDVSKFLLEPMKVGDINAELRARGETPSSSYPADMKMPRAAVFFGPKLGAFYANLMGDDGYLTMDLWWSRSFNRYRANLLPEPTESSVETLRKMLEMPDADIDAIIEAAKPHWAAYAKNNYKDGTPLQKASNTFIKAALLELNEAPERASDRKFMYETTKEAQRLLRKSGVKLSVADIQAALWYYEKRLYSALSGRKSDDIGYAEAIRNLADKGDRSAGRFAPRLGGDTSESIATGKGRKADGNVRAKTKSRVDAEKAADNSDVPFSKRARNVYGPNQGQDLIGLPSPVMVDGERMEFHGFRPAQDIAAKYQAKHGPAPTRYAPVDEERAKRIAAAYDKAKHDPSDPEVKAAYKAMIDETLQQYEDILDTGLKIEFITGEDPYAATPRLAILDVVENNHLWVFPTTDGFGSSDLDVSDNPLLAETKYKISGKTAVANDIFRVVHDYFGHIANGVGFRADGEENAWREHASMYSPLARRAMTSETRGQNSWVNFGPAAEANRTASAADTTYADQKTTLLPKWVSEDGRTDGVIASKRATLNVGMEIPGGGRLTRSEVEKAVTEAGTEIVSINQHKSNSEDTLVIEVDPPLSPEAMEELSLTLRQEAIPQRMEDGSGELYGPKAEDWGPYNPEYFLMPDGKYANETEDKPKVIASKRAKPFYSAMARSIEQGKGAPTKASADQWKGWLDGAQRRGEFKQAERDWLGVDAWLDSQTGKVSKDDLLAFVRANEVDVTETVLGSPNKSDSWSYRFDNGEWLVIEPGGFGGERFSTENAARRYIERKGGDPENKRTKFESFQLPGGTNYRELLLTLPGVGDYVSDEALKAMRDERADLIEAYWRMTPGSAEQAAADARISELEETIRAASRGRRAIGVTNFMSSHFDQPNILAHVRFNERTDADGKRVLFLEEIQSDWHQKGRKQGYKNSPAEAYDSGNPMIDALINEAGGVSDNRVPDAPFKKEWPMLAFKRMVRWAAENGFDSVAWTTGEQQAERYDLSKQVRRVEYTSNGYLLAEDKTGRTVISEKVAEDKIEDYIGKDVAKKLLEQTPRHHSGLTSISDRSRWIDNPADLKVGGEGMRKFYDSTPEKLGLVDKVNNWAKAFGGKVGRLSIDTSDSIAGGKYRVAQAAGGVFVIIDKDGYDLDGRTFSSKSEADAALKIAQGVPVHALPLTDSMRDAAMAGLPMFSKRAPSFNAKKQKADAVSAVGVHYAKVPGLTELDPRMAGTGAAGRERRRFGMGQFGKQGGTAARLGFYVWEDGEPMPAQESVVRDDGGRYPYMVNLTNLYDLESDPLELSSVNVDSMEEEISDAGYDGYLAGRQPGIDSRVAVVFDIGKKKIPAVPAKEGPILSRGRQRVYDSKVFGKEVIPAARAAYESLSPEAQSALQGFQMGVFSSGNTIEKNDAVREEIDAAFVPVREAIRSSFGDVVTLYRAQDKNPKGDRSILSWSFDSARKSGAGDFIPANRPVRSDAEIEEIVAKLRDNGHVTVGGQRYVRSKKWPDAGDDYFMIYDKRGNVVTDMVGLNSLREILKWDNDFAEEMNSSKKKNLYSAQVPVDDIFWVMHNALSSEALVRRDPAAAGDNIIASRRTPAQANQQRASLLSRLAAQGFPMGSATQLPGGQFAKLKDGVDFAREKMQDKMLRGRRLQEAVTVQDVEAFYDLENHMYGRVRDQLEQLDRDYVLKLQAGMKRLGVTVEQMQDYLLARHAQERNERIATINPAMQDAGSGIKTADAQGILAGTTAGPYSGKVLDASTRANAANLARLVDAMRDITLTTMVEAGLMTPQLEQKLRSTYKHYVPLRGKDSVEPWMKAMGRGKGLNTGRANVKRAGGRGEGNLPENILGELVGDLQRATVQKGKAEVSQAFLKFAMAHPMPDLYTVEPVDLEWKFDKNTGEAWLGVKSAAEDDTRAILVPYKGSMVRIRFEDERLARAIVKMGAEDFAGFVKWFGWLNRWRSAVLTRFNPGFAPVNITRDAIFGITAITAEQGPKIAGESILNYGPAIKELMKDAYSRTGDSSVPDTQKTMADWAVDYSEQGAKTGMVMTDDVMDLQKKMSIASTTLMQLARSGKPFRATSEAVIRAGKPIVEAIENFNDASENALRLSVYVAMRKAGKSKLESTRYAKNVTINFNRKGEWGPVVNAIFLFYNAAMQGTHAVIRVMKNPAVSAALVGLGGLQMLVAMSMSGDDDDDGVTDWDKIPDYVKRTSFIVPLGDGAYFAVPMPYGFNLFTYAGGRMGQWQAQGSRPTDNSMFADVVMAASEAFSPVPLFEGYNSMFGDSIGFAMSLASNKDDLGRPIAKENAWEQYDTPNAIEGKPSTPRAYIAMSQMLAKLGGGNLEERIPPVAYLDVAPEQLEAVGGFFTGGLGNIANKGIRWWEQFDAGNLNTALDKVTAAPIASRFVGQLGGQAEARAIADRYYGEAGEMQRNLDVMNDKIVRGGDPETVLAERQAEVPALEGIGLDRYKRPAKPSETMRGGNRGDIKVSAGGKVKFKPEDDSPLGSLKDAKDAVTGLNKAINQIRQPDITNAQAVEIAASMLPDVDAVVVLGLEPGYNAAKEAPNRVRQRAIKALQERREMEQKAFLQRLEQSRRGE